MSHTRTLIACVVVVLAFLAPLTTALQFSLKAGEETCLSEDVMNGELIIGDFTVNPTDGRIAVTVADANGLSVYSKSVQSEGKFAHTANKAGEYRMCFHNSEGYSTKVVALVLSSGTRDYKELAKKDNLKPLELELKRLEDTIVSVHAEMKYLQEREIKMRDINDSTSARVIWFSVLSIVLLVALTAGQIFYLKKYFQGKKLIQ